MSSSTRLEVLSDLVSLYPELRTILKREQQAQANGLAREPTKRVDEEKALKTSLDPLMKHSPSLLFSAVNRGLLSYEGIPTPGPAYYEPAKAMKRSASYSIGRAVRPLSDPARAAGRHAVKTDKGNLSPGPVYTKFTTIL